jgi:hypothetical protein
MLLRRAIRSAAAQQRSARLTVERIFASPDFTLAPMPQPHCDPRPA